jgi:RNA polymerase sigma factor (sigma-70 family)
VITDSDIATVPVPLVLPQAEPAPPTPRQRNQRLLDRIRSGDKAAATEMMEANMPLVHSTAWRFMEGYIGPEGRAREQALEEFIERGMEGLCDGVHHIVMGKLKHDNVTGYLARWIEGAMHRPDDGLVSYLPADRRVEQMKREDWKRRKKTEMPGPEKELMECEQVATTMRLLMRCCKDKTDRKIVRGRLRGRTIEQLAEELGISPSTVHGRLKAIRQWLTEFQRKST